VLGLGFGLQQLIERSIPLLELAQRNPHPRRPAGDALGIVAPFGQPSPAMAIAHEVGLKPPRQAMFAARCGQSIDDQHQSAITQCRGLATAGFGELVDRAKTAQETEPNSTAAEEISQLYLWITGQLELSTTGQPKQKATKGWGKEERGEERNGCCGQL
jgi:hypothetical protein